MGNSCCKQNKNFIEANQKMIESNTFIIKSFNMKGEESETQDFQKKHENIKQITLQLQNQDNLKKKQQTKLKDIHNTQQLINIANKQETQNRHSIKNIYDNKEQTKKDNTQQKQKFQEPIKNDILFDQFVIQSKKVNINDYQKAGQNDLIIIYNNQLKCTLKGNFSDGKLQGYINQEYEDGSIFSGEYKNGKKNGFGKFIWSDGSYYEGNFQNNHFQGKGKYVSKTQSYDGQWHQSLMHGFGQFKWIDGKRYIGEYVNGMKEGFGTIQWPNSRIYKGKWKAGKPHDKGYLISSNGIVKELKEDYYEMKMK